MRISTEIASAAKWIGNEKAVEEVAKAGFDAWDFSLFGMHYQDGGSSPDFSTQNYMKTARRLKQIGLDCGIVCNQSHAPFAMRWRGEETISCMKRSLEMTAEAGGTVCVIHPNHEDSCQENAEYYQSLVPFARSCGVRIAAENMFLWDEEKDEGFCAACGSPEDFCGVIDTVGDDFFVACADVGHAEMRGSTTSAPELIRALGHRLQALHLHDNDKHRDSHALPFTMQIDFQAIVAALKDIDYQGDLTLEADTYIANYGREDVPAALRRMADAAKRLREMF